MCSAGRKRALAVVGLVAIAAQLALAYLYVGVVILTVPRPKSFAFWAAWGVGLVLVLWLAARRSWTAGARAGGLARSLHRVAALGQGVRPMGYLKYETTGRAWHGSGPERWPALLPATMAAVLVVTACTATPTITVGPTIGPPTAPPSETAAQTDASDPTLQPPSSEPSLASPTVRSDPALAELIPDEVKGRILRKESVRGEEAVATLFPEDNHAILGVFLQELGASFEDYSYARGWYGDEPNERGGISIVAMRVRGADPDALLREVMLLWSRESDPGRNSTRDGRQERDRHGVAGPARGTAGSFLLAR